MTQPQGAAAATGTGQGGTTGPATGQPTTGTPADAAGQPATLTQADVDRIVAERLARQQATLAKKYGDLDGLKAKADAHDQAVDAARSDQEKAVAQAAKDGEAKARAELGAQLASRDLAHSRLEVAIAKGLPEDLAQRVLSAAKRLVGDTREELEADAAEFFGVTPVVTAKPGPRPDPSQGARGDAKPSAASGRDLWAQRHPTRSTT